MKYASVTLLAFGNSRGYILPLEVLCFEGQGRLTVTGQAGNTVMHSIRAAITTLRYHHEAFGIDSNWTSKTDVHIHFPYMSVCKDGPSCGLGIILAILTSLKGKGVSPCVAASGEITLSGDVCRVGHMDKKLSAVLNSDVSTIFLPEGNAVEVASSGREFNNIHYVKNVFEAWELLKEI